MEFSIDTNLVIITNIVEKGYNKIRDLRLPNENRDWLYDKFPNVPIIIHKKPSDLPIAGWEHSSYLKFFYDNYDNLPQKILCLHGHENAHHQPKNNVYFEIIKNMQIEYPYFNISEYIFPSDVNIINNLKKLWDKHFKPYMHTECPQNLSHMCCAQFIVKKEAVLLRSREAYKHWYELSIASELEEINISTLGDGDSINKTMAQIFEIMWHAIFGEPYYVSHTEIAKRMDILKKKFFQLKNKI